MFELTDKETADIVRQVDSLTKQDIGKPHAVIDISSHTPFVFRELGLDDLKVVMYRGKLARGLYLPEGRRHGHSEGLDKGIVKKVLESFADPVYVFDSRTDVNSLVAVYDVLDKHDNPMMPGACGSGDQHLWKNQKEIPELGGFRLAPVCGRHEKEPSGQC